MGNEKDYIFEQISPDAGFAFDQVSTIVEDENGFIWFGCNNGLYYYNSLDIIKYKYNPTRDDSPPSNVINKLYKDWNKTIWICTDNGICYFNKAENSFIRIDLQSINLFQSKHNVLQILQYTANDYLAVINKKLYSFTKEKNSLRYINVLNEYNSNSIVYLDKDNDGNIILGAGRGRIFISDSTTLNFTPLYDAPEPYTQKRIKSVCHINSHYWIGYGNAGVAVITTDGQLVKSYNTHLTGEFSLPNNRVSKIIQRKNGDIWIGTLDGIQVISENGNHTIKQNQHNRLPLNIIFDLYIDKNDGIWVGTWTGGLAYYSEYNYRFEHIKRLKEGNPTRRNVISSFAENTNGTILIGSETLGLYEYDCKLRSFIVKDFDQNKIPFSRVESLVYDKNNTLWIGTFNQGLWKYANSKFTQIISNINLAMTNMSITLANNGLWIAGTGNGLFYYDIKSNKTTTYKENKSKIGSITSNFIRTTFLDSKENLWICSNYGLSLKRKDSAIFERFFYNQSNSSISRNIVYTIAEDSKGKIWIGTSGGGIDIYDPESNSFHNFEPNSDLNNADIYSIIKDLHGDMWISSDKGIFQYNTQQNKLKGYSTQDGILGNQYNPNAGFCTSSGRILFGGANGFNIIEPKTVKLNPIVPKIFLSKLLVNYQAINDNNIKSTDSKHLADITHLELKHTQNSLVFGFVTNNFIKPSKNKFKYRVKNYLDNWIESNQGNDISLAKIPPGHYVLEIIGSNNDGVWNKVPKEIDIIIHPPFWLSWYAYVLYAILISIISFIIIREIAYREKIRKEMMEERYKHNAEEMLFSEKTKFFTNISHEFRTPLTLIISPLNSLIKKFENEKGVHEHLKIMQRNADRLLRLTNQILDFRLIELGKVKIDLKQRDIVNLCENVVKHFEFQIIEKQMNCIFTSSFKSFELPIDAEQIEKIVYNLISNAFKYSQEKGQIIVSLEQKEITADDYLNAHFTGTKFVGNSLEIKIKDSGRGISPVNLPIIFDRFFVDAKSEATGTGIGLHICQEYIRLHNGNIMVSSVVGKGTVFAINLPINSDAEFKEENIIVQSHFDKTIESVEQEDSSMETNGTTKIILFAEDNDELRVYLKNVLLKRFKVLTAKNGQQAFEIASEVIPDLILSDILMPGIDGLKLTQKIRENQKTNHIPIILLTALTDSKYQIDSMQRGADSFLTKPVDESLLFARIENILSTRETLKKKYNNQIKSTTGSTNERENFEQKAERIVVENLQNSLFDIENLATELSISRSSLHRKIKSTTNQSPSEFIRDIRLRNAVKLMKAGKYNIDEIGTYVGFNSTSYFIRSFKKKYGQTPKEYYLKLKK